MKDFKCGLDRWLAAVFLISSCTAAAASSREPASMPNVVLISLDTLRADRVHAYGYPRQTTPNLDVLASDSVLFSQARSPASWTLPSHASIFLGLDQTSHGVISGEQKISEQQETLAELLRLRGYHTAGFYSGYLVSSRFGFSQGFDLYQQGPPDTVSPSASPAVNAKVLAWLGSKPPGPFFLFVHYFDIHDPYSEHVPELPRFRSTEQPPSELAALFTDPSLSPRAGSAFLERAKRKALGQLLAGSGIGVPAKLDAAGWESVTAALAATEASALAARCAELRRARIEDLLDAADRQWLSDSYDEGIRYVDAFMGRFLDALRQHELYDQTLIVVTSDHGETLLDRPGRVNHRGSPHEPVLHVPLIIKAPGGHSSRRVDSLVSTLDIFRTVLDYTGIQPPKPAAGESLRAAIEGRPVEAGRTVLSEDFSPGRAHQRVLYALPWKLIALHNEPEADRLYNLDADPGELANEARRHDETYARLRGLLRDEIAAARKLRQFPAELAAPDSESTRILRSLGYAQ